MTFKDRITKITARAGSIVSGVFSRGRAVDDWRPSPSRDVLAEFPGLNYRDISTYSFNGEKNLGEAGPMINYRLDYIGLSARSWQAMLESDKAKIGINRLTTCVIGKGLKPQVEPITDILDEEGVKLDKKKYAKLVEAYFNLFRNSKSCDYSGRKNLNELSWEAEKNSLVGGDVLVILRLIDGQVKIQHIDRENVQSPYYGSEWFPQALANGNTIVDGVEINSRREHVAFYVRVYALDSEIGNLYKYKFDRIPARGDQSGMLMAYLYYGDEHRINNERGIPLMSVSIERLRQMEEYAAAMLKQAKEAAKVDYQVEHDLNASGQAPWANQTVKGINVMGINNNAKLPTDANGEQVIKNVRVTKLGTAINNNPGSKITMLENKNPMYFKEYDEVLSNSFFALIGIPPNVAMMLYNDSYSASRASIMDWLNTLIIKREHHRVGYLKPIFDFWLEVQIYQNKIQAPGYLLAKAKGNEAVIEAYRGCRFIGINPAHIDPLNEANAIRVMLGKAMDNVPLIDVEQGTERLGNGTAIENIEQVSEELQLSNSLNIKPLPIEQKVVNDSTVRQKGKKKNKSDKGNGKPGAAA